MKNAKEILDSLASPTPSKWREKAEWRRANRQWLRKSQKIALAILECMSSQKMTQKQLAEKLGVSPQYVSRILKGSENLSLETISKIESVLEIEILSINTSAARQQITNIFFVTPNFKSSQNSEPMSSPLAAYSSYNQPTLCQA